MATREARQRSGAPGYEPTLAGVARVLIVPCGCRGRALAAELRASGHAVRGSTRSPAHARAIAGAGAEPYVGDPDRIGTLMDALYGVTVVCWLMGTVAEDEGRVRMLWSRLVDTPVRGVVYEGAFAEVARAAAGTFRIPLEVLAGDPLRPGWVTDATAAVRRLLS